MIFYLCDLVLPYYCMKKLDFFDFFPFCMTNVILDEVFCGTVVIVLKQKDPDSLSRPSELSPTEAKIN